jgi:D-arabinose 1-dehydrogenase-like Zn-dependent alcohol dehydrogenase
MVGECEQCKARGLNIMFCPNKKGALGLQEVDGSFAEYVIADSRFTVPIPDNVSFADAVTPHIGADNRPH